ncbi:MFS transporter [Sphingobium sp. SYK-6]|uniref:MFS transporter n=1 Tax=Sphingobium sp. (strain NBRC 103272 / SYK-6) TaxID=627192 RepID=UPI0009FE4AA3|nr:MFS transporter [Sphingobium sp. SYK-6]
MTPSARSSSPFFPPVPVTIAFLGVTLFVLYLGWTMMQIPFLAWSGELSKRYHERTRVATYVQVISAAALLATLIMPTIADQLWPSNAPLKLAFMGGLVLATLVPTLILTVRSFPDPQMIDLPRTRLSPFAAIRVIGAEPLLRRVLASDFAVTLAQNIRAALFVFFVAHYMGRPHWGSGLFLLQFVFGIFAGPIWMRIGYRFGKHRTAIAGELAQVAINLGLLAVTPSAFPLLIGLTVAQGLAQGSGNLMLRSIVADIADKHRLETGDDRTGLFFSVFSLSGKAATAVAVGIALPLVAWLGFDPKAARNSDAALTGLLLVFALGPAIAHAFSALLIRGFALDEAAHAEIRRQLDGRAVALSPAE